MNTLAPPDEFQNDDYIDDEEPIMMQEPSFRRSSRMMGAEPSFRSSRGLLGGLMNAARNKIKTPKRQSYISKRVDMPGAKDRRETVTESMQDALSPYAPMKSFFFRKKKEPALTQEENEGYAKFNASCDDLSACHTELSTCPSSCITSECSSPVPPVTSTPTDARVQIGLQFSPSLQKPMSPYGISSRYVPETNDLEEQRKELKSSLHSKRSPEEQHRRGHLVKRPSASSRDGPKRPSSNYYRGKRSSSLTSSQDAYHRRSQSPSIQRRCLSPDPSPRKRSSSLTSSVDAHQRRSPSPPARRRRPSPDPSPSVRRKRSSSLTSSLDVKQRRPVSPSTYDMLNASLAKPLDVQQTPSATGRRKQRSSLTSSLNVHQRRSVSPSTSERLQVSLSSSLDVRQTPTTTRRRRRSPSSSSRRRRSSSLTSSLDAHEKRPSGPNAVSSPRSHRHGRKSRHSINHSNTNSKTSRQHHHSTTHDFLSESERTASDECTGINHRRDSLSQSERSQYSAQTAPHKSPKSPTGTGRDHDHHRHSPGKAKQQSLAAKLESERRLRKPHCRSVSSAPTGPKQHHSTSSSSGHRSHRHLEHTESARSSPRKKLAGRKPRRNNDQSFGSTLTVKSPPTQRVHRFKSVMDESRHKHSESKLSQTNNSSTIDSSLMVAHLNMLQSLENLTNEYASENPVKDKKLRSRLQLLAALERDRMGEFQKHYQLSDEDLETIEMHVRLCQKLNEDVHWDLVFEIMFPPPQINDIVLDALETAVNVTLEQ